MYELIDTHAHLDEMKDLDEAIERARVCGLSGIVAMGVDYESNNRVLEIAERYKSIVFPALGCHPGDLPEENEEIERNLRFIEDNIGRAVAVGEIGLDYHKKIVGRTSKDMQKQVFRQALEIAVRYGKPVSVHSRYAWRDCLTCVQESQVERAVFHWYTGPVNVLREFIGGGYLASATLAVEYHEEHRRAIRETPFDRLMLETDSPVPYRLGETRHNAEPADVTNVVVDSVAQLKNVGPDVVAERTTANARAFFGIQSD
ncbi:MAG: TatD family hydrolase [Dehalococcoidia bacterium]